MANVESKNIELLVSQLIEGAIKLFPKIVEATKQSDERAKRQKVPWHERHRLNVLIEAAEETKKACSRKAIVAPWFLAELKSIVEIGFRWHDKPIWKDIEPSLVNSTHFTHTMAKLRIAEHLQKAGHKVEIIPRGENASPDLMVQAIGGTQDWINIECYQPSILSGGQEVATSNIQNIVKKSMKKAKLQLGRKTPGILAICGFNQKQTVIKTLKETIIKRLQRTDRPSLCGIALVMLGILYKKDQHQFSFTPFVSFDFIPNPSYFGRVEIDSRPETEAPNLMKQPLADIATDNLKSLRNVQISAFPKIDEISSVPEKASAVVIEEQLKIIMKPAPMTRVVMYSEGKFPPIDGEGNINFLCGCCKTILAEHAWKLSISNIIVKCQSCGSYNEFPTIKDIEIRPVGTIAFEKGEYPLKSKVRIRRGIILIGK